MLALEDSEVQALRIVQNALEVDLILGAKLAGEAKSEFNAQTVKLVEGLDVLDLLKVRLLGETRSDTAILALFKLVKDVDSVLRRILVATALGKIGSCYSWLAQTVRASTLSLSS